MNQLSLNSIGASSPLSYEARPKSFEDFYGHSKEIKIIQKMMESKNISNMVIYGPPGTGKTTISKIISSLMGYRYVAVNATKIGVTTIKQISTEAKNAYSLSGVKTILLFDEIHRFNKSQQDSLLEDLEEGSLILIGTTTENPYYSLNKAILSRCLVIEFKALEDEDIFNILKKVASKKNIDLKEDEIEYIVKMSGGDARYAINTLELIQNSSFEIVRQNIKKQMRYDINDKYDRISALIKSIRGSDEDATVYWLASLLVGGEDVAYIARRLVISASEDIGLANPNALNVATSAMLAVEKIGMPEARIILSECALYLAMSPKSNSAYSAINSAMEEIQTNGCMNVPYHLRKIGKSEYKYPHAYKNSYVKQKYLEKDIKFFEYGENKTESKFKQYWEKIKEYIYDKK